MCILCGELWTDEHWAEVAAEAPGALGDVVALEIHVDRRGRRLRERAERARLFGILLTDYGLKLQDWEGSSYILRDPKGNTAVIHDLAALWKEVERMVGRPLDPLDPDFLVTLRGRTSAGTKVS